VLQSARKLFAGRYGKTRTRMSRGRSVIEVILSDIVVNVVSFALEKLGQANRCVDSVV
jgi:hypothetical protein